MERLARSEDTPMGEIATRRLITAALEPDRYRDGTAFIAGDAADFELMLTTSFAERRPVALIYPGGREVIAAPEAGALVRLLGLLRRRRARRKQALATSVEVPESYRVETRRDKVIA